MFLKNKIILFIINVTTLVHLVQIISFNDYVKNRFLFTLKVSFKFCDIYYLNYLLTANSIFDEHFARLNLL